MMTIKVKNEELKIKFGYESTLKTRLLSKLAKYETDNKNDMESAENSFLFLPEFLLIGLQKFHRAEYGFDYDTGKDKDEQLAKMWQIIEDYFDENPNMDAIIFMANLTEELLTEGFLKSQFQKEMSELKQTQAK